MYLSKLEAGQSIPFQQKNGRRIYVFVIEGQLQLNEEATLEKRDAARITEMPKLTLAAPVDTFFMLIDLP